MHQIRNFSYLLLIILYNFLQTHQEEEEEIKVNSNTLDIQKFLLTNRESKITDYNCNSDELCRNYINDNNFKCGYTDSSKLVYDSRIGSKRCFLNNQIDINNYQGVLRQQVENEDPNIIFLNELCKSVNLPSNQNRPDPEKIDISDYFNCFSGCEQAYIQKNLEYDENTQQLYLLIKDGKSYCVESCQSQGLGYHPYELHLDAQYTFGGNNVVYICDTLENQMSEPDKPPGPVNRNLDGGTGGTGGTTQPDVPSECSYNCNYCADISQPDKLINKCQECKYNFSMYGSFTDYKKSFATMRADTLNQSENLGCKDAQNRTGSFTKIYYLTSQRLDCYVTGTCQGTKEKPYDDILQILQNLHEERIGEHLEATITILLLKGGDNKHYVLDTYVNDEITQTYFYLNFQDPTSIQYYVFKAFDRVSTTLLFQPATQDCGSLCYGQNEKALMIWKSQTLQFMVTKKSTFKNIIFEGSDMLVVNEQYIQSIETFQKQQNCECDEEGNCQSSNENISCQLNYKILYPYQNGYKNQFKYQSSGKDSTSDNNYNAQYAWFKIPLALFQTEYLKDYVDAATPQSKKPTQ